MSPSFPYQAPRCVILMGASTGGPRALTEIVSQLPPLPACIVIVLHMPKFINQSFVRTISRHTAAEVRLAQHGDWLQDGLILIAPSETHCSLVSNLQICLADGDQVNYVRPSIDVLMQSAQASSNQQLIGVLLTGMGKDGAEGMKHIKKLGGLTIGQNEATCAIYGMPAQAAKLGCLDTELPPAEIARLLEGQAMKHARTSAKLAAKTALSI